MGDQAATTSTPSRRAARLVKRRKKPKAVKREDIPEREPKWKGWFRARMDALGAKRGSKSKGSVAPVVDDQRDDSRETNAEANENREPPQPEREVQLPKPEPPESRQPDPPSLNETDNPPNPRQPDSQHLPVPDSAALPPPQVPEQTLSVRTTESAIPTLNPPSISQLCILEGAHHFAIENFNVTNTASETKVLVDNPRVVRYGIRKCVDPKAQFIGAVLGASAFFF